LFMMDHDLVAAIRLRRSCPGAMREPSTGAQNLRSTQRERRDRQSARAPRSRRSDRASGNAIVAAMSSENYHEPLELLSEETRNMHRAIVSLCEELEAVDWYTQRAEACSDPELRATITHNKNEEIEHAMMNLEWIRRNHPVFQANVAKYINTSGPILAIEAAGGGGGAGATPAGSAGGLGIGSLRGSK
jgi:ferritin-like protein